MTTRTLTHPDPGPVTFDVRSISANIEVAVTDTNHASVTVSTNDTDGPSHQAVTDATITYRPGLLAAHLTDQDTTGGITIAGRGNSVSITAASISQNMTVIGGRVFMNGREITDTATRQAPVTVRAALPHGSKILGVSETGHITTQGPLTLAELRTVSGYVLIEHADAATAATTSGDIEIQHAHRAGVHTVSGDILINRTRDLETQSVSGDVTVRETTGNANVHTVSGDTAILHTGPTPRTHTVSGRVHVTAIRPSSPL